MSTITTSEFRVAYPALFQPKFNKLNNKEEYSLVALFPHPDSFDLTTDKGKADKKAYDECMASLKQAALAALEKKFGADQSKWPCEPSKMKNPFRDQGDRKRKDPETGKETLPQGYKPGAIYFNLRSNQKPSVVDQNVKAIIDSSTFYGGCWGRASINAFAYDQAGNRGVSFGLINVQKTRDDEAFGNRTRPEDDFAPVQQSEPANESTSSDLFS